MRPYMVVQADEIAALIEAAESQDEVNLDMAAIEGALGAGGRQAARKMFHMLVMTVKGPALGVLRGNLQQNGALAWRALVKRYEPNTAPRIQSLMSNILNWPQFPSDLTSYETKLADWEETIRKWEVIAGDVFNEPMKKALCVDKAPATVNMLLQVQTLDDSAL